MNTQLTNFHSITNPEVETLLHTTDLEIDASVRLQAKHDAQHPEPLTEPAFEVKVADVTEARVQTVIDKIKQLLLTAPKIIHAADLEKSTVQKINALTTEIEHTERHRSEMAVRRSLLKPDFFKMKMRPYFRSVCVAIGIADAGLALLSFRVVYPLFMALIAATGIASVIGLSDIGYTPWVMNGSSKQQKTLRGTAVLGAGMVLFTGIGFLRSFAFDAAINLSVDTYVYQPANPSGFPIAAISFVLFAFVFALSLFFYQTKQERTVEQTYLQLGDDIARDTEVIKALEEERQHLEDAIREHKNEVRSCYDYTKKSIVRAKNIGEKCLRIYKQCYAQSTHTVPSFFTNTRPLCYDESIEFIHH